jgi:aryl-alcohol dehydrogenase-like predicted oxidoreductase
MTGGSWARTLGSAGLPVTAIGLGLAALGRPGYLNLGHGVDLGSDRSAATLELRAHAVLDAAYDAGVRYFDAARSYGRAEAFLASWLRRRELAPGEVTVGSKWGYTYTADWRVQADPPEVKDLSVNTFRRQLGETRELLGDHLSLYQIHSATVESGVLDDPAVLAALAELRASGVSVGLTTSGPEQAQTVERAIGDGGFGAPTGSAWANPGLRSVAVQLGVVLVRQFEIERGQVCLQMLERKGSRDRGDGG